MGAILLILRCVLVICDDFESLGKIVPLDTDDEDQLGLLRNVELAALLGDTSKADLLALSIAVLLDVLLGTLEDDATLLLVGLRRMIVSLGSFL